MYFVSAPPKNLNSKKTVEKGKISVFSLEWNCCEGQSETKWKVEGGTVVNVQERENK